MLSTARRITALALATGAALSASAGAAQAQNVWASTAGYSFMENATIPLMVSTRSGEGFASGASITVSLRGDAAAGSPSRTLGTFQLPSNYTLYSFQLNVDDQVRELITDYHPTLVITGSGVTVVEPENKLLIRDDEPATAPPATGAAPAPTQAPTPAAAPAPTPTATPTPTTNAALTSTEPVLGDTIRLKRGTRKVRVSIRFAGPVAGVIGVFRNDKLVGSRKVWVDDPAGGNVTTTVTISKKAANSIRRKGGEVGVGFLGTDESGAEVSTGAVYSF